MSSEERDAEMIDRFRGWIEQVREEQNWHANSDWDADTVDPSPVFGLVNLVEEFSSLRQDIKLQARSARGLEETAREMIGALRGAIGAFQQAERALAEKRQEVPPPVFVPPVEVQPPIEKVGKGMALALADLDEALERGFVQVMRSQERALNTPPPPFAVDVEQAFAELGWFARKLASPFLKKVLEIVGVAARHDASPPIFQAFREGYELIQARVARALANEGISRINATGKPVDPERMIVVEVENSTQFAPGCVSEEIRRGYLWNGSLLRAAEVRAVRFSEST